MFPAVAWGLFDGFAHLVDGADKTVLFDLSVCQNGGGDIALPAKIERLARLEQSSLQQRAKRDAGSFPLAGK